MPDSSTPLLAAALGVLALLVVGLLVALLRGRRRARRELGAARAEVAALRLQMEQIERVLAGPAPLARSREPEPDPRPEPRPEAEYTITELGRPAARTAPAGEIDRTLFADLVLRESVVRAASFAHGVRRALSAEARNRIRFEVRREIRRARKQRRVDTRVAVREWEARQRAAVADGAA